MERERQGVIGFRHENEREVMKMTDEVEGALALHRLGWSWDRGISWNGSLRVSNRFLWGGDAYGSNSEDMGRTGKSWVNLLRGLPNLGARAASAIKKL
jgi:hypothetical protein